eukprot:1152536-Pelagomonas_calceolata.AAC.2
MEKDNKRPAGGGTAPAEGVGGGRRAAFAAPTAAPDHGGDWYALLGPGAGPGLLTARWTYAGLANLICVYTPFRIHIRSWFALLGPDVGPGLLTTCRTCADWQFHTSTPYTSRTS